MVDLAVKLRQWLILRVTKSSRYKRPIWLVIMTEVTNRHVWIELVLDHVVAIVS